LSPPDAVLPGTNPSVSLERPTKLVLIWSKLIGGAVSAATAARDAAGEVVMSLAQAAAMTPAPAMSAILIFDCIRVSIGDCASVADAPWFS